MKSTAPHNFQKSGSSIWLGSLAALIAVLIPHASYATVTCWPCNAALYAISVTQTTVATFPDELATTLWPLLVTIVGITTIWGIMKAVATGYSPVPEIIQTAVRFMLLSCILIAPASLGGIINEDLMGPVLDAGAGLGAQLALDTETASGFSVPDLPCNSMTPAQAGITDPAYLSAANSVLTLMCQVHAAAIVTYAIGSIVASQKYRSGVIGDIKVGLIYGVAGLFMMFTSFSMLLDFSLTMFEAIVRLGILMTFSPIIAFFWLYRATRGAVYNAFSNLIFIFVYLALSGLGAAVTITLILTGVRLGLGLPLSDTSTPGELILQFSNLLVEGATINSSGVMAQAFLFCAYSTICTMIAMAVHRGLHDIALEITQQGGSTNQRTMSVAAVNSISTVASIAVSSLMGGAAGLGRIAGKSFAKRKML